MKNLFIIILLLVTTNTLLINKPKYNYTDFERWEYMSLPKSEYYLDLHPREGHYIIYKEVKKIFFGPKIEKLVEGGMVIDSIGIKCLDENNNIILYLEKINDFQLKIKKNSLGIKESEIMYLRLAKDDKKEKILLIQWDENKKMAYQNIISGNKEKVIKYKDGIPQDTTYRKRSFTHDLLE